MEYRETVFEEICRRLAAGDRCMAQEHAQRVDLAKMDVRYLFGAGVGMIRILHRVPTRPITVGTVGEFSHPH